MAAIARIQNKGNTSVNSEMMFKSQGNFNRIPTGLIDQYQTLQPNYGSQYRQNVISKKGT